MADAPPPFDARLARWLVRPLAATRVTPNHLTTLRLLLGLAAAAGVAAGTPRAALAGAWLFALSNLADHTDGELARLTGQSTPWGHRYDLACDVGVHALFFAALGWGLRAGPLGAWAPLLGLAAGGSVATIFALRMGIEGRLGKAGARLPALAGFEIEDCLYLVPLVAHAGGLPLLLGGAAAGAPLFALWLVRAYRTAPAAADAP
ncbi:MAG: CDP-alcohol phosphatidyltransferase family protein [Nitrospirae bacterium]|nr:MAG: CDP-alcohol phosphatidyltransferase family protein [Nitrospirota bacterium]